MKEFIEHEVTKTETELSHTAFTEQLLACDVTAGPSLLARQSTQGAGEPAPCTLCNDA